jgi:amino acid transporter
MSASNKASAPGLTLVQVLTFWDLVIYGLAYVAPVGPWSTFGFAYNLSGGLVAFVFALGALALSFTAVAYAQMCNEVPEAGSVYAYARYSMGETVGFLAGWVVLLDYLLIPALMFVFCGISLNLFIPTVPRWVWVLVVAAYNLGVNWFGVETSARFNRATLFMQFALVAAVLVSALFVIHRDSLPVFTVASWWRPLPNISGVFAGASLCVMSYLGFDAISTLSSEVRPDQRHLIGRAIIFSIVALGTLAVINVWTLSDLGRGYHFNDWSTAAFDLIGGRISPAFGRFVTWSVALVTAVSITPPMVTAVARVLYAMAENGEMPRVLSRLHPRYRVPHIAILASGALSIAVALTFANEFDELTSMVNFGALTAFIAVNASVIALFVVRRRSKRLVVHLLLPVMGIGTIVAVMTQMSKVGLGVGASWLILGIGTYGVRRHRAKGRNGAGAPLVIPPEKRVM